MDASYYKKYEPVFGSWKIKKKLGEGNFGAVFEIEREDFGTTYHAALKAITIPKNQAELDSIMDDGMDASATQEYLEQFVEKIVGEFVLMSKLKGNSNVVSYEDHQVIRHENGVGWDILIRMELLTPMMSHFKSNPMTRRDVIKLGIDMCRALELCQKYNIIHRDIKPENIFISDSGDYKLGDFGIAKEVEKTQSGLTKTGTPTYMAPEVYKGQPYGSSVDLYSLGVVLYRLLNHNRAPFMPQHPNPISYKDKEKAFIMRLSGQKFPMPTNAGSGRLAEIAMKACSYKPEDRYSSPTQMREDLEAILYTEGEGTLMFPAGDHVEVKSIGYVSDDKKTGSASDDLTAIMDSDSDETITMPTSMGAKRSASRKTDANKTTAKKKKWIIPVVACACAAIAAGAILFATRGNIQNDTTPVETPDIQNEIVLENPVEFSMNVLHMNESDFNLITKRLDTYGVNYTADKSTKTFAVSSADLGADKEETALAIAMLTGVGKIAFTNDDAAFENDITREDITNAYVDESSMQFVMELTDDGKEKLAALTELGDELDLYVDGRRCLYARANEESALVIDMPREIVTENAASLFVIRASASEYTPSDNFIKLVISIIVNGEMTKEYDVYIDEKYGIEISEPERTEASSEADTSEDTDVTENSDDSETAQSPADSGTPVASCSVCGSTWHTVHPTCSVCGSTSHTEHPVCSVCGSTAHTVHPACAVCGSIAHTVHPTCSVCGSTDHTTHPSCVICGSTEHTIHPTCPACGSMEHTVHPAAPTITESAGMPEIYIDFD